MVDSMEDPAPILLRHFRGHHGPITCVAYNHHSNKLASSSTDKSVNLWNTDDRIRCYKFTGHSDAVNGVAWSHNGQFMATASKDRTIKVKKTHKNINYIDAILERNFWSFVF